MLWKSKICIYERCNANRRQRNRSHKHVSTMSESVKKIKEERIMKKKHD